MCGDEVILDGAMHRADEHIAKPRESFPRLLRGYRTGQDARADQEHVLLTKLARAVEQVFVRARLGKCSRELTGELVGIRQRAEERRLDQRVHEMRIARQ